MEDSNTETTYYAIKDPETGMDKLVKGPKNMEMGAAYSIVRNPETGEEEWVKNPTSKGIGYTYEQFKAWVDNQLVPNEQESFGLKQLEKTLTQSTSEEDLKNSSMEEMLALWKSQTSDLGDAKQNMELITFLLANKEKLLDFLQKKPKSKPKKVRHSGHYVDRKLEYTVPHDNQPSLFDLIDSPSIKERIESGQIETKTLGIKLSPQQDKMINSFYKLLADKSETHDESSEHFYAGNEPGQLIPYGHENQKAHAPYLRIRPHDLYKEYLGKEDYSGKEAANARSILREVNEIKFLIIYDRKRKVVNGTKTETRTDRIEVFQELIKIIECIEDMTEAEVSSLNRGENEVRERKGSLVVALNPLLTDQINSKYVEYPTDINQRTMIAAGGHRHVTESMIALRDYMMREISSKRYQCELNADNLPYLLKMEKYVKSGRKGRVQKRIEDSFRVVKALGIVSDIQITTGAEGQKKYVFLLNKDFD